LSTGPTSLIGLLTSDSVRDLQGQYSPSEIASAVAMMMGVYGMILGFLKLGFLLEFVSLPILGGFISAVAITIILNQMGSLLGEDNIRDGTANQIHDVFAQLPKASGYTCLVGFTGILLLTILDQAGKRWGQKNKFIWFLSITRAFLCLVFYTAISYAVNRDRQPADYLFQVIQVKANGQEPPRIPSADLIAKVASRSIAVFIGATVEHTAIARAFGVKNNYVPDQSQELCYFGVANFFNSFFHAMGVGGAMSRTSVNSACNVKSPLSGFITTAVVLVSIFKLVSTLYWIPKATLAAIIITAVWPLIHPPAHFYRYWKISLADFVSSMLAFWISLFVSTELGIAISVGFNIVYCVLRQVFVPVSSAEGLPNPDSPGLPRGGLLPASMPPDARIFRFNESLFFANSYRITTEILDSIQTHHAPRYNSPRGVEAQRNWSVVAEKRTARHRRRAGIRDVGALPPIHLVVLDFGRVNHIDTTAVDHIDILFNEIRKYGGADVELRFAHLSSYVQQRFERAGWNIAGADMSVEDETSVVRCYDSVALAVTMPRMRMIEGFADDEKLQPLETNDDPIAKV